MDTKITGARGRHGHSLELTPLDEGLFDPEGDAIRAFLFLARHLPWETGAYLADLFRHDTPEPEAYCRSLQERLARRLTQPPTRS